MRYRVTVEISGIRQGCVDAESEEEAKDKARRILEDDWDDTNIDWIQYREEFYAEEEEE